MPPPRMIFRTLFSKTKKAASENKSKSKSKSKSISFSPETKQRIANFTKKRDELRGFRSIKNKQATKKRIASFTRKRDGLRVFRRVKNKQEANRCAICLDTMLNNGPTTRTPCKHKFHRECLDTWLISKNSCPECRKPIQAPIIVPQRTPQMAAMQDANDDAHELAILQLVENYWTERGRTPVEVELLKLCKLVSLKLARLVRRHSVANTNSYTRAQTNARTYAVQHRLDLDYYYSLEDTYNPSVSLEIAPTHIMPSSLRTAYTI